MIGLKTLQNSVTSALLHKQLLMINQESTFARDVDRCDFDICGYVVSDRLYRSDRALIHRLNVTCYPHSCKVDYLRKIQFPMTIGNATISDGIVSSVLTSFARSSSLDFKSSCLQIIAFIACFCTTGAELVMAWLRSKRYSPNYFSQLFIKYVKVNCKLALAAFVVHTKVGGDINIAKDCLEYLSLLHDTNSSSRDRFFSRSTNEQEEIAGCPIDVLDSVLYCCGLLLLRGMNWSSTIILNVEGRELETIVHKLVCIAELNRGDVVQINSILRFLATIVHATADSPNGEDSRNLILCGVIEFLRRDEAELASCDKLKKFLEQIRPYTHRSLVDFCTQTFVDVAWSPSHNLSRFLPYWEVFAKMELLRIDVFLKAKGLQQTLREALEGEDKAIACAIYLDLLPSTLDQTKCFDNEEALFLQVVQIARQQPHLHSKLFAMFRRLIGDQNKFVVKHPRVVDEINSLASLTVLHDADNRNSSDILCVLAIFRTMFTNVAYSDFRNRAASSFLYVLAYHGKWVHWSQVRQSFHVEKINLMVCLLQESQIPRLRTQTSKAIQLIRPDLVWMLMSFLF